ncbi:cupin-like domain-containing protein [Streptomyces sp. NPDC005805]|uniref:cupin-like domain-containing protein n=1 Tax=Streptomyces sp. NPDC005805 TaxID=3157068 RepID=UPI0033FA09FD
MPTVEPVEASPFPSRRQLPGTGPALFRGLAAAWPAVDKWTPQYIGALAPDMPIQLVVGNRESGATRFSTSTLGAYVDGITGDQTDESHPPYLKEFDLLRRLPELRRDLRQDELFPRRCIRSSSAWIGPRGSRTGLHYDILDNFATVASGRKRFLLARPGAVEQAGHVSGKYDPWAVLARCTHADLARAGDLGPGTLFQADLGPGDVLYVPAGWWHEVVNLSPSVLISGFFGKPHRVVAKGAAVAFRNALHLCGFPDKNSCTCHAPTERTD